MSTGTILSLNIVLMSIGGRGATILNRLKELDVKNVRRISVGEKKSLTYANNVTEKIELSEYIESNINLSNNNTLEHLQIALKGVQVVFLIGNVQNIKNVQQTAKIAKIARENGALVLYASATPFAFEGSVKLSATEQGKEILKDQVDGFLVIDSNKVLAQGGVAKEALTQVDAVIGSMVNMITELVLKFGTINVDFADLKTTIQNSGGLLFNSIQGNPDNIEHIVNNIFSQSFLDTNVQNIKKALYVIYAGPQLLIEEVQIIGEKIKARLDDQARIIFGVVEDKKMRNDLKIVFIGG